MRRITAFISVTLDGVMQAPGRPDEDTRGAFAHGGWALPYNDEVMGEVAAKGMAAGGELLFGRRTFEDFHASWANQTDGNPFTDALNNTRKYVASRTATELLDWQRSTLLRGDAAQTVAELKARPGPDITVLGSGDLLQTLIRNRLVDEFILLIHPLVLGTGRKVFAGDYGASLRLVDSVTTTTGVIIATYQASEQTEG